MEERGRGGVEERRRGGRSKGQIQKENGLGSLTLLRRHWPSPLLPGKADRQWECDVRRLRVHSNKVGALYSPSPLVGRRRRGRGGGCNRRGRRRPWNPRAPASRRPAGAALGPRVGTGPQLIDPQPSTCDLPREVGCGVAVVGVVWLRVCIGEEFPPPPGG